MPVLILDDNFDTADIISLVLTNYGFSSVLASSGHEALRKIDEFQPESAVLDLRIPDISGFDVARAFRNSSHARVRTATLIAHSGDYEAEAEAIAAGFDYFVQKPSRFENIVACLGLDYLPGPLNYQPPKVDFGRLTALSERSARAIERAKNLARQFRKHC